MAVGQLGAQIQQSFAEAMQNQEQHAEYVQASYRNETSHLLKQWGCNSTCVDRHFGPWSGADYDTQDAIQECDCPAGIKYNETNEPFADVDFNKINSEDVVLSGAGPEFGRINV